MTYYVIKDGFTFDDIFNAQVCGEECRSPSPVVAIAAADRLHALTGEHYQVIEVRSSYSSREREWRNELEGR
jgi:hypothetical protein